MIATMIKNIVFLCRSVALEVVGVTGGCDGLGAVGPLSVHANLWSNVELDILQMYSAKHRESQSNMGSSKALVL